MKNLIKKCTLLFVVLLLAFSCISCEFSEKVDNTTSDDSASSNGAFYSTSYVGSLPSSLDGANSTVTVNNNEVRTGDELSYIDAIEKVDRSAVAIIVQTTTASSAGSGTIVNLKKTGDEDNIFYVLTCYHVIASEGATVTVYLPDANNRNYGDSDYNVDEKHKYSLTGTIGGTIDKTKAVSLVGADKYSDIALLRLNVADETVKNSIVKADIMDSTKYSLCKGYSVFAIGNPTGVLQGTVSRGYISYVNREVSIENIGNMTLNQINLDIYHGSSGGGLYNFYGELVGITNAGSDEDVGLNYSIALSTSSDVNLDMGLYNVARQLLGSYTDSNYGYVSGRKCKFDFVVVQDSTSTNKPLIYSVTSGGLADKAGLKANDTVVAFKVNDGEKVTDVTYTNFTDAMNNLSIGDTIVLTVERTSYTYNGWGRITGTETKSIDVSLTVYQFYFYNSTSLKSASLQLSNAQNLFL